ncbi:MAG: galactose oxidase-like domain-containing protein [Pseudomonadota bacterium]
MFHAYISTLSCQGCVAGISGKVKALDPNATIRADLDSKMVTIDTQLSTQVVAAEIESAGHRVAVLTAPQPQKPTIATEAKGPKDHGGHGGMSHGHGDGHGSGHDDGHSHEHGAGFGRTEFCDPRLAAAIEALAEEQGPAAPVLTEMLATIARIESAADLARAVLTPEPSLIPALDAAIDRLVAAAPAELPALEATPPPIEVAGPRLFCIAPFLDILSVLSYRHARDPEGFAAGAEGLLRLATKIGVWAEGLSLTLGEAAETEIDGRVVGDVTSAQPLLREAMLDALVQPDPPIVPLAVSPTRLWQAARLHQELGHLIGLLSDRTRNPISVWCEATDLPEISGLAPQMAEVSPEAVLRLDVDGPIGDDTLLLFSGSGIQIPEMVERGAEGYQVTVPAGAPPQSTLRLIRKPSDAALSQATALLNALEAELRADWLGTAFEAFTHSGLPLLAPQGATEALLKVRYPPQILSASLRTADGVEVDGEDDRPSVLGWDGFSVDSDARVTVFYGDRVLGENLPQNGEIPLPEEDDEGIPLDPNRLTISIEDWVNGTVRVIPDLIPRPRPPVEEVVVPLSLTVKTVSGEEGDTAVSIGPVDGWSKGWRETRAINLKISCGPLPPGKDTTVQVVSDNSRVVVLTPSVPLRRGDPEVRASIKAIAPGNPGDAVRITVRAADTDTNTFSEDHIDVYVVPEGGRWTTRGEIAGDVVAVHAALMPNKKVLFFAPGMKGPLDREGVNDLRFMNIGVFDPDKPRLALEPSPMSPLKNLFCAGHAHLPDGTLLVAGGHIAFGSNGNLLYRYEHDEVLSQGTRSQRRRRARWSSLPSIKHHRWYPTVTCMPDGRMLIVSGSSAALLPFNNVLGILVGAQAKDNVRIHNVARGLGFYRVALEYEFFDPSLNRPIQAPKGRRTLLNDRRLATYPFVFVLPKGQSRNPDGVLMVQDRERAHLYSYRSSDASLTRERTYFLREPSIRTFPLYGSAVLLPVGHGFPRPRVLILGGGSENDRRPNRDETLFVNYPATDTAEIVEFDPERSLNAQPGFRSPKRLRMRERRFMSDAVLLPDGSVFVSGGAARGYSNANRDPVRGAELYDPTIGPDGFFRRMATALSDRLYHAVALLLADGTVMSAGSTGGFPPEPIVQNRSLDIWEPPYLWRGKRPRMAVLTPPDYDQKFAILVWQKERVKSGVLMRLGSVTHANNMDQRCVSLEITRHLEHRSYVELRGPKDKTVAPPGPYMLFIVSESGVPSEGEMVLLS